MSSRLAVVLAMAGLSALTGCASPGRPMLTDAQLAERAAADSTQTREMFRAIIGRIIARVESQAGSASGSVPEYLDILAMSGGGDFGAFGAGFLVGWGLATDPASRRPDFDVVTGVSTGALLAPFAYVGTDDTLHQADDLYRNPKADWTAGGGLLSFIPSNPSFMTIPGLQRDIRKAVGSELIGQMAEQSRKGKVLLISATDLDLGRQTFWDMGTEAEAALASGNVDRVQQILFASSAIPAVFPPIAIDGSLYADGGVTANVFLRLDSRSPDAFLPRWKQAHPDKPLPKVRYWVIINNQLSQTPKTVQAKWPAIIEPSLATAIRSATVAEVRWLAAQADYVNATSGTEIEVRVVAIPDSWRPPVAGDFKKKTMESLADLGRKMGADPASWKVWATHVRSAASTQP